MTNDKRPKGKKKQVFEPSVDAVILNADGTQASDEAKFDTGMRIREAVEQARFWWENIGRKLVNDKNLATDNPGYGSFNPNPKTVEEAENWLPSGVLSAKPWDDLNKDEKISVVKIWYLNRVRVQNIDPELYLRAVK